jgi:hypothetical protein
MTDVENAPTRTVTLKIPEEWVAFLMSDWIKADEEPDTLEQRIRNALEWHVTSTKLAEREKRRTKTHGGRFMVERDN